MAQHDYVIDNSTGANVRADINNALLAISSNNSGSSAPSTTYALQSFANTTDSMLQLRNAANNAFVNLRKFDGTLPLPDGSASSPSLFFDDDTNTGIFSSAADTINFATGGVERMELGTTTIFNEDGADVDFRIEGDTEPNLFYVNAGTNRIGVNQSSPFGKFHIRTADSGATAVSSNADEFIIENTGNCGMTIQTPNDGVGNIYFGDVANGSIGRVSYDHSSDSMSFNTGANERMRLDNTGQLLLGHSGSSQLAGILAQVNIETTAAANLTVKRNSANEFDATISLGKTRATSIGGATIVQQNDRLGTISFFGSDGNDTGSQAASIRAECDGTPGVDDMPGRLLFMTTADGANGSTERMRIDSSGNIAIGTTSADSKLHIITPAVNSSTLTTTTCKQLGVFVRPDDNASNTTGHIINGISFGEGFSGLYAVDAGSSAAQHLGFFTGDVSAVSERMRIDSSGNVGIGTTPERLFHLSDPSTTGAIMRLTNAGGTSIPNGTLIGQIEFESKDSTDAGVGSIIRSELHNTTTGSCSMYFKTGIPSTLGTQMALLFDGTLVVGNSGSNQGGRKLEVYGSSDTAGFFFMDSGTTPAVEIVNQSNATGCIYLTFNRGTGSPINGTITKTSGAGVNYNTSSDYRLKENVVSLTGGITRLKTLLPKRFNWIADESNTVVDGFLAHEVTAVPEAIVGTKDQVDADNNPVYQQIDQSKLVPLLVAAVQELISKVEALEAA